MAKSELKVLDEIRAVVQALKGDLDGVGMSIVEISKNARNAKGNFEWNSPKKVNEEVQKTAQITEQVAAQLKEQERLEKALISQIAKKEAALESTNKALIKQRYETQQINKAQKEEAVLTSKLSSFYQKQNVILNRLTRRRQDLLLKQELGIKLDKQETAELARLTRAQSKLDKALKNTDKQVGQNFRNVGNYKSAIGGLKGVLTGLVGAFGVVEGLRMTFDFTKEAIALAREAKGVEFAFENLGIAGTEAFDKVKKSTRGLLSDLDIKKSIIEFDNFNLEAEQLDKVLEFVAVRASQTGKSFEYLRDSAIEAISKESVRRADNLGLSQKELNDKIKEGTSFLDAFTEIAQREVAEAGDILDEAANSQQKFNAALENFKVSIGSGFIGDFTNEVYGLGEAFISTLGNINDASDGFWEFTKNLLRAGQAGGASMIAIEAAIKREQKSRIPLVNQIIAQQEKLGIADEVIIRNKKQLLELGSEQLKQILNSYDVKEKNSKLDKDANEKRTKAIEGSIAAMQAEISELKKLRDATALTNEEYEEFNEQIKDLEHNIKLITDGYREMVQILDQQSLDNLQQGVSIDFDVPDDAFITQKLQDSLGVVNDSLNNLNWDDALLRANDFFQEIGNLSATFYDNRIQRIEDEINRNDLYYSELLRNEELTLRQREALEAEQENKRLQLEKKKREEQRKQAIAQKAFAASQVVVNTAVAISKTLAETGVFGIPLTAIVAAQGAIQLAAVLAQPIPQFEQGLFHDYEGKGKINDQKGSRYKELVIRKSGQLEMFHERNKVIDIKKGDRILPAQTTDEVLRNSLAMATISQHEQLSQAAAAQERVINVQIEAQIEKAMSRALKNMPSYPIPPSASAIGAATAKELEKINRAHSA